MLVKKNWQEKRRKEKKTYMSVEEKRIEIKKGMLMFFTKGKEEIEEEETCLLWNERFYLLRHFTDDFTDR